MCFLARPFGAVDRGLDLQRILAGLDQDRVDAAGDQPGALNGERVLERLIGDIAERGEGSARADRAEHKTAATVMGELGDGLASELGGTAVERKRPVGEAEF